MEPRKYLNFRLVAPCSNCPFRRDCMPGWLNRRVDEIANYLEYEGQTFSCHKTTHGDTAEESHCAGALHLVHKMGIRHRGIGMAKAFDLYDGGEFLKQLHLTFDTFAEFRAHHKTVI